MRNVLLLMLMWTVDHTPVIVHAAPFANITTCNSITVADNLARDVITKAGFGNNVGMTTVTAASFFCWSLWRFDLPFLLAVVLLCQL